MKRVVVILHWVAMVLTFFVPVASLALICFGYRFYLGDYKLYTVVMASLLAVDTVLSQIFRDVQAGKSTGIMSLILPPMVLVNWGLFVFQSVDVVLLFSLVISFFCSCVLALRYSKKLLPVTISIVLSTVLLLPLLAVTFLEILIGQHLGWTVVETVYSPEQTYYAQVIDDDQGGLGGASHVYVYENSGIDLGVFRTEKLLKKIYYGRWMAYTDMEISWRSDNCLVIDGKEYLFE